MFDGEKFGKEMVEIVRGYMAAQVAPLLRQIEALEKRLADLEEAATKP